MSKSHLGEQSSALAGWPGPPFVWPHRDSRPDPGAVACRVDTIEGRSVQGLALDTDPHAAAWRLCAAPGGPLGVLKLARAARITLTAPLKAEIISLDVGLARVPTAGWLRDYSLRSATGQELVAGKTAGHVETDVGLFLFEYQGDEVSLQRVFVPRVAGLHCDFGPLAASPTAGQGIKDPASLRAVLSELRGKRMPRIGEALTELGLATAGQIDAALKRNDPGRRLGERLIDQGVIKPEDLQAAIAFKLGYPLVDLAHFPIDPQVARKLPDALASQHCAIPICIEGRNIFVAVDGPTRLAALEDLKLWPGMTIIPVLAPRGAILVALATLRGNDPWAEEAPWR